MWAFDCGYIAPAKWGSDVSLYSFLNSGPIVAFAALFMLMNPDYLTHFVGQRYCDGIQGHNIAPINRGNPGKRGFLSKCCGNAPDIDKNH